jgi:magnesium transporter
MVKAAPMTKKRSKKAGLPPGSLVFLGEQRVETASISILDYTEKTVRESSVRTAAECLPFINDATVTWINITGLHDTALIQRIGETFDIHPLLLEDVVSTGQRPKFQDHGNLLFFVLRMLYKPEGKGNVISEQVSIVIGRNYVLTFQEMPGDVFDIIRNRIRTGGGRIRTSGADYLAYALIDAIVDNYFSVLEELDDKIEAIQQSALDQPVPATLNNIHGLKHELVAIRRQLWPLREAISSMQKTENGLLTKALRPYLHDVYEHTYQILETIESMREMISTALETYMSSVSNRMNEIMKVLTIISTIFIPLTFIAGIYGMNFERMPELSWPMGYPAAIGAMVSIAVTMVMFFKRRHWL